MKKFMILNNILGIIFCLIIAIPAWLLGRILPIIGGPVFAILFGIIITTCFKNITKNTYKVFNININLKSGIKVSSKQLLQYSIILLGFSMNLNNIIIVGKESLFIMLFTFSTVFLTAYLVGKALKIPSDLTTLIGVGTSICGGSAIAATAPVINAKDEDIATSISIIFLFNIIAVLLFPFLGHLLNMGDAQFGVWAGTAINDTSSVVAASTSWSINAGNDIAANMAIIVKLTRTLMIVPITLFLAFKTAKKAKQTENNFKFSKVFPWFILFFILAALINTTINIPANFAEFLNFLGKFMIVIAMVAIGLNTNLKNLLSNGFKPLLLGISCWFVISIVALIVQFTIL